MTNKEILDKAIEKAKAKGYVAPKKTGWTAKEKRVFKELGVGEDEISLRKLIRGQRNLNGRFYESIELIIKHLNKQAKKSSKSKMATPELKKAGDLNDGVPGDPPGCPVGS